MGASRTVTFEFLDACADGAVRLIVGAEPDAEAPPLTSADGAFALQRRADALFAAELHPSGRSWWVAFPEASVAVGRFFPCSRAYRHAGCRMHGYHVAFVGERLTFRRLSPLQELWRRLRFWLELAVSSRKGARKAAWVRPVVACCRLFRRRPLWLISDRMDSAGDNGEALFRFLRRERPGLDVRFVVSSRSPSFVALREVGPVVSAESKRRKILTLLADRLVSSQAERAFSNPFAGHDEPYRDLLARIPVVFLQHGVIKDDLSATLCRRERNFAGFVVSAPRERDSVCEGAYGYDAAQVWMTGLPRFDRLESHVERRILIQPTWRLGLVEACEGGGWRLKEGFEDSDFCRFYRALLTDVRLLDACRRHGYAISFRLHPNLAAARRFFTGNDVVEIDGGTRSYAADFAVGALLLTDYSSTAFDFAYLRKPVVYAQFDAAGFFGGGHTYAKGYFDYGRDGFGEVETTLDAVVDRLTGYLVAECALKPEYRRRIDGFFAFAGGGSCARVTERILGISEVP